MVAVNAEAIRAAQARIPAVFRDMPQFVAEPLGERHTVADEIAARVPVAEALSLMLKCVDDMQLVGEAAILSAQAELSAMLPFSIEPSAAVGSAALLAAPRHAGAVGLILTGGNIPPPGGDVSAG